jgi:hypothetical protein
MYLKVRSFYVGRMREKWWRNLLCKSIKTKGLLPAIDDSRLKQFKFSWIHSWSTPRPHIRQPICIVALLVHNPMSTMRTPNSVPIRIHYNIRH